MVYVEIPIIYAVCIKYLNKHYNAVWCKGKTIQAESMCWQERTHNVW